MLAHILDATSLDPSQLHAVYQYGSRVYDTHGPGSDWDFIVVASDAEEREYRAGDVNVHVNSPDSFQQMLDEHRIHAMECFFLPPANVLLHRAWKFELDRSLLRREVSAKSSNSWAKSRKKLTVAPGEEWTGVKSIFHAMRIVCFGIQIGQKGFITDFAEANHYWREIRDIGLDMQEKGVWDWVPFRDRFKPEFNRLLTEFRTHAAKA